MELEDHNIGNSLDYKIGKKLEFFFSCRLSQIYTLTFYFSFIYDLILYF